MLLELKIIKSRYVNSERIEREKGEDDKVQAISFWDTHLLSPSQSFYSSTPTWLKQINEGIMPT